MSIFYRRDLITDQKLEKRLETEADLVGGKIPLGKLPNTIATKEYVNNIVCPEARDNAAVITEKTRSKVDSNPAANKATWNK